MFHKILLLFLISSGPWALAESCETIVSGNATPAWMESLRETSTKTDADGNVVRFHYDPENRKFINIACGPELSCAQNILQELKEVEPSFAAPDSRLNLIVKESIRLAHRWNSALSLSWIKSANDQWTVRLSIDVPPAGRQVLQSSGVTIESQARLDRIDVTVEPERTTVMFANIAVAQFGNELVTSEIGSHGGGVVLETEANPPFIDSLRLRREFFVGPNASPPLLRALEAATAITFALRPNESTLELRGHKGVLAQNRKRVWIWSTGH